MSSDLRFRIHTGRSPNRRTYRVPAADDWEIARLAAQRPAHLARWVMGLQLCDIELAVGSSEEQFHSYRGTDG
jgi:hypothetical protein